MRELNETEDIDKGEFESVKFCLSLSCFWIYVSCIYHTGANWRR